MDPQVPSKPEWYEWVGSIFGSALVTVILVLGLVLSSDLTGFIYGPYLFVAVPFGTGFAAAALLHLGGPATYANCALATTISVLLQLSLLMVFALEGAICIVMASPLLALGAWLGCLAGHSWSGKRRRQGRLLVTVLALLPITLIVEVRNAGATAQGSISTELIIEAPPAAIWPFLQDLPDLDEPTEPMFRWGVAHPTAVRTEGSGIGAARFCTLSTGDMREEIEAWEPARLLQFKVLETPASMRELNPFGEVEAPHLRGYFECTRGRFILEPLKGGRTRLIGTTWYEFRIFPAGYWSVWTDKIVSDVQLRVMREIKQRAEAVQG